MTDAGRPEATGPDQGRSPGGAGGDPGHGHHRHEHGSQDHPHRGYPDFGGASAEPGGADEFDALIKEQFSASDKAHAEAAAHAEADAAKSGATTAAGAEPSPDAKLAAERLADLQRLQAEYVNYKRRVDRDRDLAREGGVLSVIEALLPVLDDIHAARLHGELADSPFGPIADKLERTLAKLGHVKYGEAGEGFDPQIHEALMHLPDADLPEGSSGTTIVQVLMPGHRVGDRVIRAARVAVADPN